LQDRRKEYSALAGRRDLFAMGAALYQGQAVASRGTSDDESSDIEVDIVLRGGDGAQSARAIFDRLKGKWGDLPQSESEVDNLAAIFAGGATIYKKGDASEAKLLELNRKGELAQYRYIVFSTHGFFSPQEPGLSSIVLNQINNSAGTDGYISAIKWPMYHLKSDLMFLSACETGVGKVVKGEGVMGLPYALYVAGNTSTVFTLWKVVDESSALFSKVFFTKVKAGKSHIEALSETKREFMADSRYSAPIFWAPYVLYGI